MEVGAEGAEEAHRVHGPAANLCVCERGDTPIREAGRSRWRTDGAGRGGLGQVWH